MGTCCCSLAGTAACRHCPNNEYAEEPIASGGITVSSITVSTPYFSEVEEYEYSVPVVRCAFCEYYIKHDKRCAVWNHGVFKDDYCSRGVKKDDRDKT